MSKPILVITGNPPWLDNLHDLLADAYRIDHYTTRATYVSRLVDDLVALIFVDGDDADWRFWTATPKSSPASRRIPIFLVSTQPHPDALASGADMTLTPDDLLRDGRKLAHDFARVPDPERMAQLDCECAEPLPELAQQGVEKFNAGAFYKQHDLFEELWMATDGPVRDLYRAILQVGVAYYQIQRGNHRGARKMLLRSVQWLAVLPDACQGIDVKALRDDSYRVRAELEKLAEDEIDQFDHALLQPVKFVSSGS